jgi:hypothetical protein
MKIASMETRRKISSRSGDFLVLVYRSVPIPGTVQCENVAGLNDARKPYRK